VNDSIDPHRLAVDIAERERARPLAGRREAAAEMIAKGRPLAETLLPWCCFVEGYFRDSSVSVLLLDATASACVTPRPQPSAQLYGPIDGSPPDKTIGPCGRPRSWPSRSSCPTSNWTSAGPGCGPGAGARTAGVLVHSDRVVRGEAALAPSRLYARQPGSPTARQRHQLEQFTHLAASPSSVIVPSTL